MSRLCPPALSGRGSAASEPTRTRPLTAPSPGESKQWALVSTRVASMIAAEQFSVDPSGSSRVIDAKRWLASRWPDARSAAVVRVNSSLVSGSSGWRGTTDS